MDGFPKGLFINDVIIFGGFHVRPPFYWEYIVYCQYMGSQKWKPRIPAENDDVTYEHCCEQPLKKTPSKIQERVK